jgi:hypothetical protein
MTVSATKVILEDGREIDIPRDVESDGKEAIDRYVDEQTNPPKAKRVRAEAAPEVAE